MAKEIDKGISKGKDALIGILFMKIKEIGEKGDERSHICIIGNLKENEEIRLNQ